MLPARRRASLAVGRLVAELGNRLAQAERCMPDAVTDSPTSAHEKVFLLAKNANYFYDQDAIREPSGTALEDSFSTVGARARRRGQAPA